MVASDNALRRLLDAVHFARPEDLPDLAAEAALLAGIDGLIIYLVDYAQATLMPLASAKTPPRDPIPVDATLAGRAFSTVSAFESSSGAETRLWLPLLDGTERLGVLEFVLAGPLTPALHRECELIAALLGEMIVARRFYGDAIERVRRRLPMQLAAEVVWSLLPPLTFSTASVEITGILEPCYEVGGDTFDYAINGDIAHLAVFDAVGHGTVASTMTAITVSAYRNARRCGLDLVDTCRSVDKWLGAQYPGAFVTATFAELDTATGRLSLISAGHPAALLMREGRLVKELPAPTGLPLGFGDLAAAHPVVVEEALQPSDVVLLYTDGVVEARTESGDFFGVDRLVDFIGRALADQLPAPETMRRLMRAIMDHQHERLQDDASALLLHWRGAAP
jgi:phosphoserine phosphatase RsbU/P